MRAPPSSIVAGPNALMLARVPLAAALSWDIHDDRLFFAWLVLAGVSDVADGWLARRARHGSPDPRGVGAWLDPLCDKIFVLSAVVATIVATAPPLGWTVLLVARELVQAPLMASWALVPCLRGRRVDFRAVRCSKLTTGVQFSAIVAMRTWPAALPALASLAAALGVWSVVVVARRAWRTAQASHATA